MKNSKRIKQEERLTQMLICEAKIMRISKESKQREKPYLMQICEALITRSSKANNQKEKLHLMLICDPLIMRSSKVSRLNVKDWAEKRKKKKDDDPRLLAAKENEALKKRKNNWNEKDRLRNFMEATTYNAIFICTCCLRRLFHETVEIMTQKLRIITNAKNNGLIEKCLGERIETPINGNHDTYLCKTCITHMKAG